MKVLQENKIKIILKQFIYLMEFLTQPLIMKNFKLVMLN